MRKGKLALVIYILGVIATGALALFCHLSIRGIFPIPPDTDALGYVLLIAFSMLGLGACAILLVLRILNFITKWRIFPFISIVSLIYIIYSIGVLFWDLGSHNNDPSQMLISGAIFILPFALALISEIRALGN